MAVEAPQTAEVKKWAAKANDVADPSALVDELNKHLEPRTFIVGSSVTDADIELAKAIRANMKEESWSDERRVAKAHVWRWFDLIQHLDKQMSEEGLIEFRRDPTPEMIEKGKKLAQQEASAPKVSDAEREAKAAAKKAAKEAKKAAKKEKPAAAPTPKKEESLSVTRLDIRVGNIVKAENHPDADALYVEQIEVGEAEPRTVCSGLRKYFPEASDLLGPCVVICNLKPAKMRGITSAAMVLCATSQDGNVVELVKPPEGSAAGTRVTFEGEEGEPDAQLNPKKQIFEKIAPDLKTNDSCVATWKDKPFRTPEGECTVKSVQNGGIK